MSRSIVPFVRAATLAALAVTTIGAHAANLIKGGGFESPLVPVGGFTQFETGSTMGPWTVVGVPGDVAIVSTTFQQNGITFNAKAGKQWLDMTGFVSDRATGVAQTVKTVPGQTYTLKFAIGNVVDPSNVFGSTSSVDVLVNGAPLIRATHTGGGATALNWKTFTANFTATGRRTTVSFINADPLDDNSNGLDAVTLTAATE